MRDADPIRNAPTYEEPMIVFVGAVQAVTKMGRNGNICDGTPCDGTGWRRSSVVEFDHDHIESEATKPRGLPPEETSSEA